MKCLHEFSKFQELEYQEDTICFSHQVWGIKQYFVCTIILFFLPDAPRLPFKIPPSVWKNFFRQSLSVGLSSGSKAFFLFFFVWEYLYFLFIPKGVVSLDMEFVVGSLLWELEKCCFTSFWPVISEKKKKKKTHCHLVDLNWCSPVGHVPFLSNCFLKIWLSLVFRSLIMILLAWNFLVYSVCSASWICRFVSLAMFEEFSAIFL